MIPWRPDATAEDMFDEFERLAIPVSHGFIAFLHRQNTRESIRLMGMLAEVNPDVAPLARGLLRGRLVHGDAEVVTVAVYELWRCGTASDVGALRQLLERTPSTSVRCIAERAIRVLERR